MHGNTPYAGRSDADEVSLSTEQRRTLARDSAAVAARARELLPAEFVVGSEVRAADGGVRGTVAVRPPVGSVVRGGIALDDDDTARDSLVRDLVAGAALEVKQRVDAVEAPAK